MVRLFDLIYGDEDKYDDPSNMNGIRAKDDYIMAGVYFEADLNNLFFRKTSSCKSYQPPFKFLNKIDIIPLYNGSIIVVLIFSKKLLFFLGSAKVSLF